MTADYQTIVKIQQRNSSTQDIQCFKEIHTQLWCYYFNYTLKF